MPDSSNSGWQCPVCKNVFSPSVVMCPVCAKQKEESNKSKHKADGPSYYPCPGDKQ